MGLTSRGIMGTISPLGMPYRFTVRHSQDEEEITPVLHPHGGGKVQPEEACELGFTPLSKIKEMFGNDPEKIPGKGTDRRAVKEIQSTGTKEGNWFIKRHELGDPEFGIPILAASLVRRDLLMRGMIDEFLPEFVVPEMYACKSERGAVIIVSKGIDCVEDKEHFLSMSPEIGAKYSVAHLIFGFTDHAPDNIRKCTMTGREGDYAIIDFGRAQTEKPMEVSPSVAMDLIKVKHAPPYIKIEGGNTLDHYKKEHELWEKFVQTPEFKKRLHKACECAGMTPSEEEDYFNVIRKNVENYLQNIGVYIACVNEKLALIS